ncbi:MAG: hypothetical protein H0U74_11125 [Bradymonadaceae bacterium]|nr:hypothetical protein [Lujinxingiaceae bacterium]
MITSKTALLLAAGLLTTTTMACGEAPAAAAVQDRCEADLVAAIGVGKAGNYNLALERSQIDGSSMTTHEITLKLADVARADKGDVVPLLMRIYDKHNSGDLLNALARLTDDAPLVLDVIDATEIGAGSQNRTDLTRFDCGISKGTICVQVGLDTNGDGLILNNDDAAYNASSGQVTIRSIQNVGQRINLSWDVRLGANILAFGDTSTGNFTGCVRAKYEPGGNNYWLLR